MSDQTTPETMSDEELLDGFYNEQINCKAEILRRMTPPATLARLEAIEEFACAANRVDWDWDSDSTGDRIRKALGTGWHLNMSRLQKHFRAACEMKAEPQTNPPATHAPDEKPRCEVCGWTLAKSVEDGCVEGNCSYRPDHGSPEHYRIQKRRAELEKADELAAMRESAERLEEALESEEKYFKDDYGKSIPDSWKIAVTVGDTRKVIELCRTK